MNFYELCYVRMCVLFSVLFRFYFRSSVTDDMFLTCYVNVRYVLTTLIRESNKRTISSHRVTGGSSAPCKKK